MNSCHKSAFVVIGRARAVVIIDGDNLRHVLTPQIQSLFLGYNKCCKYCRDSKSWRSILEIRRRGRTTTWSRYGWWDVCCDRYITAERLASSTLFRRDKDWATLTNHRSGLNIKFPLIVVYSSSSLPTTMMPSSAASHMANAKTRTLNKIQPQHHFSSQELSHCSLLMGTNDERDDAGQWSPATPSELWETEHAQVPYQADQSPSSASTLRPFVSTRAYPTTSTRAHPSMSTSAWLFMSTY